MCNIIHTIQKAADGRPSFQAVSQANVMPCPHHDTAGMLSCKTKNRLLRKQTAANHQIKIITMPARMPVIAAKAGSLL